MPQPAVSKSTNKPVTAAKPAQTKSVDAPGLAAAQKKFVDKPALGSAKPMTKRVQIAKTNPLAPVPDKHSTKPSKDSPTGR